MTLRHVLWIGGASGAGKTSVATRLMQRHGLRWYSADARTWEHRDRALASGSEPARRWETLTRAERAELPPGQALELSLHAERGQMVVDDLRALPRSPLVVADGTTLPAAAVDDRSRAVWLIPTQAFQRRILEERGASSTLAAFSALLRETIEREAREHGLQILEVDGSRSVDATVDAVEEVFAEALAEGPCAASPRERRALIREANGAIAAQVRGFYARPWAEGDAEQVVREFSCECGDRACGSSVPAVVRRTAEPLLAPGHG